MRIILISWAAGALAACGGGGGDGRTQVVAGFYPLAFAAERVGGGEVEVANVTPPGAEPHDIELTARDVSRVIDADVLLYAHGFQPALDDVADRSQGTTVDVLESLDLLQAPADEHGHEEEGGRDPHVWLDPVRFAQIVDRIGEALDRTQAADELEDDLRQLDRELETGLADCERRAIVTSHAAFGYLARRYDLEQVPITGVSPEAELRPGELEEVIEHVEETGATTVFFETLVSPRLAETVARETGARTAVLNPIEGLTEEQIAEGENYFSLMRANLAALREALGCR